MPQINILDEQGPSVQSAGRFTAVQVEEVEEMYSPKGRNWRSLSENTDTMVQNLSEETISESSQIKG